MRTPRETREQLRTVPPGAAVSSDSVEETGSWGGHASFSALEFFTEVK